MSPQPNELLTANVDPFETLATQAKQNELIGLIELPDNVYHDHRCPGATRSGIIEVLKSPAHYQKWLRNPDEPTKKMEFGTAGHLALLEPEKISSRFVKKPEFKGTGARTAQKEFEELHQGKILLSESDYRRIGEIVEGIYSHAEASALLEGLKEKTFFWKNPETGLLCKTKPDCLNLKQSKIVDLKIGSDHSKNTFQRKAAALGYHLQHAFYFDGINEALKQAGEKSLLKEVKEIHDFVFLCIEDEAPYAISIYRLNEASMLLGRERYQYGLHILSECYQNNQWPAYSPEIQEIGLPAYAFYEGD